MGVRRFRKRPVEVEAIRYDGENAGEILSWATRFTLEDPVEQALSDNLIVHTLHGQTTAVPGDWILKGPQGDFWPCQPEIFEDSYEIVG